MSPVSPQFACAVLEGKSLSLWSVYSPQCKDRATLSHPGPAGLNSSDSWSRDPSTYVFQNLFTSLLSHLGPGTGVPGSHLTPPPTVLVSATVNLEDPHLITSSQSKNPFSASSIYKACPAFFSLLPHLEPPLCPLCLWSFLCLNTCP